MELPYHSLYVHYPFCRSKCAYCDFYSEPLPAGEEDYLKALLLELSLISPEFIQLPTVYFGGGTPSLAEPTFFEAVLSRISQFSEVSVEFNPEDCTLEKLRSLKELGVNRVSIGIQSFSPQALKAMGRRERSRESLLKAVETALSLFDNVSLDLIYASPGQSVSGFLREVETAVSLGVKHISIYALTLYEETPLFTLKERGEIALPTEDETYRMYYGARELLLDSGFNHYEISNFALPGYECRHNLNYWRLRPYLGIGASASSFSVRKLWKNVSNFRLYAERLFSGKLPVETGEEIGPKDLLELKVMMGLRLTEGVSGIKLFENEALRTLKEEGLVSYDGERLKLLPKAYFISNAVIARLLDLLPPCGDEEGEYNENSKSGKYQV